MSPAKVFCFPQIHLHFATHAGDPGRRRPSRRVFPAATVYRERVTLDRGWTSNVTINRASQPERAYRPRRIDHAHTPAQARVNIENAASPALPRFNQSLREELRPRQQGFSIPRIEPIVRVNKRREELTHFFKTHWHTLEHSPLVLSLRPPSRETLIFAGPTQQKSAQVQLEHPEELVWRRAQSPATVTEDLRHPNIPETTRREPVPTFVEETSVQPVTTPIGRAAQQQITKLDPALVDRLTDDVIRRFEQRARIERQRRGL